MASRSIKEGVRHVRPLLSLEQGEAKRRVLNLYKAWYRQIPFIGEGIFAMACVTFYLCDQICSVVIIFYINIFFFTFM
jgi:hypothetical protein